MTSPFLGWFNVSKTALSGIRPTFLENLNGLSSENQENIFNFKHHFIVLQGQIYLDDGSEKPSRSLSAEALLQLYLTQGSQCLTHLTGHFTFAIISNSKKEVFLARDKIGTHSLFYHVLENGFVFSNHCHYLKSSLADPLLFNAQSIYDYFYFHYIPSAQSVYDHVFALEPGHYALYRDGKLKTTSYWKAHFSCTDVRSFKEKATHLKKILTQSITENESVKTGCFLSGGIDSSTVLGYLSEYGKRPVKAFSIGFDAERFNEMEYAEVAAKHFHATHIKYFVTPEDVIDALPLLAQHLDQPFGNASLLPTYFCAKLAKDNDIDCLLAGDGGDELFGGNSRYATQGIFARYHQIPKLIRSALIEPIANSLKTPNHPNMISKLKSYIEQAKMPMPDRQERYNLLTRIGSKHIFTSDFLDLIDPNAPLNLLKSQYASAHAYTILGKVLSLDLKFTLADNDLRKVVSACQLAGVQVGFPFLDEQLIQFALRLSDKEKVNGAQLRYFYKKAMSDFLPKKIIAKTKHGFGLPFGLWLSQHSGLQAFIFDQLMMLKNRKIILPRFIDELINTLLAQHPNYYGVMAWTLAMFELWMQSHTLPHINSQPPRTQKTRNIFDDEVA